MSDAITDIPPPRRGLAWLAWIVILGAVVFEIAGQYIAPQEVEPAGKERAAEMIVEEQGRNLVGLPQLNPMWKTDPRSQRDSLDTGPLEQRFRFIILTGESDGPGAALEELADLDKRMETNGIRPTEDQQRERDILERLYRNYKDDQLDAPSVSADERKFLIEKLGWTGRLALAPAGGPNPDERDALLRSARQAVLAQLVFVVSLLLLGAVGLLGLILLIVLLATGTVRAHFRVAGRHGAIYAEAFAVWILLFLAMHYVMNYAVDHNLIPRQVPRFALNILPSVLEAVVALSWPVLRGIPWRQVRQDVGLTFGRRAWLEPLFGFIGYIITLPLLGLGALLVVLTINVRHRMSGVAPQDNFAPSDLPAHPITEILARPDMWIRVQIFLLACIMAPLVEEVLFRGLLFRHLREATNRFLGRAGSFLLSATVVSFVFAAIHPQGVLGVPALMALAFGFALLREWRGSLIPSIMAHGINNSIVLAVNLLTLPT